MPEHLTSVRSGQYRVQRLDKNTLAEQIGVMARAVSGTPDREPELMHNWMFGPRLDRKFDDAKRFRALEQLSHFYLLLGHNFGLVIGLVRVSDGRLLGLATLNPPGQILDEEDDRKTFEELGEELVIQTDTKHFGRDTHRRMLAYYDAVDQFYFDYMEHGAWYINFIVVDPPFQGQGLLRCLLECFFFIQ